MNDPTNADWNRLVHKTRRRTLITEPNVVQTAEGTTVRMKRSQRLGGIALGFGLGLPIAWGSFYITEIWQFPLAFVFGGLPLCWGIHRLFFPRSVFIPADANEVIVRYGFFLLPTRLVLQRQSVVVDYQNGAETKLSAAWSGFKIILLRHVETQEVAHLCFNMKSEDALPVFDALSRILAEGSRKYT